MFDYLVMAVWVEIGRHEKVWTRGGRRDESDEGGEEGDPGPHSLAPPASDGALASRKGDLTNQFHSESSDLVWDRLFSFLLRRGIEDSSLWIVYLYHWRPRCLWSYHWRPRCLWSYKLRLMTGWRFDWATPPAPCLRVVSHLACQQRHRL